MTNLEFAVVTFLSLKPLLLLKVLLISYCQDIAQWLFLLRLKYVNSYLDVSASIHLFVSQVLVLTLVRKTINRGFLETGAAYTKTIQALFSVTRSLVCLDVYVWLDKCVCVFARACSWGGSFFRV